MGRLIGRFVVEVLRFMVGFAEMHPTDRITWDCEETGDIGPMPLGYPGSFLVSFLGGWFLMWRYWSQHPFYGMILGRSDAIGFSLGCGFCLGMIYLMAMTIVNWAIYAIRMRVSRRYQN